MERDRAEVRTATPARYAKQLVSHFGRKNPVAEHADRQVVELRYGDLALRSGDGILTLEIVASSPDQLADLRRVVTSHLERFGARDQLQVDWVSAR